MTPNFNSILAEITDRILNRTGLTAISTPGSFVRTMAEVVAKYYTDTIRYIDNILLDKFLDTAVGSSLDSLATIFSVTRYPETYAHDTTKANVRFYIDPIFGYTISDLIDMIPSGIVADTIDRDNKTITILKGTRLYDSSMNVTYETLENVTLSDANSTQYVNVVAAVTGEGYNIGKGQLVRHNIKTNQPELQNISDFILVENTQPISNGRNMENDEQFKYRIKNRMNELRSLRAMDIKLAALSVEGVSDVIIRRNYGGIGITGVIVLGTAPVVSDGVIKAVEAVCNQVCAAGEKVIVIPPLYRSIRLRLDLVYDTKNYTSDQIENDKRSLMQTIIDYINNIPVGGTLEIGTIKKMVFNLKSIKDGYISYLKSGVYNRFNGEDLFIEDKPLTDLSCDWNEKFYTTYNFITIC